MSGLGHHPFFCFSCPVFLFAELVRKFIWEGRIRWSAVLVPVAQWVDNAIYCRTELVSLILIRIYSLDSAIRRLNN